MRVLWVDEVANQTLDAEPGRTDSADEGSVGVGVGTGTGNRSRSVPRKQPPAPPIRSDDERNAIVVANLDLAYWGASRFLDARQIRRRIYPWEDAICDARCGLIRAAELYQPERGAFTTYAYYWMRWHMYRGLKQHMSLMQTPDSRTVKSGRAKYQRVVQASVLECWHSEDSPLSEFAREPDTQTPGPQDTAILHDTQALVRRALSRIHPDYAQVAIRRAKGDPLHLIARDLDISKERVRQMHDDAKLMLLPWLSCELVEQ